MKLNKLAEKFSDEQVELDEDMAEILDEVTKKIGENEPTEPRLGNENEPVKPIDEAEDEVSFAVFKNKIRHECLFNKILKQMRINFYEDASMMIMYQGVRTNTLGRLRSNGIHTIYRSAIKKQLNDILELKIKI